jgi:hypothetical protein
VRACVCVVRACVWCVFVLVVGCVGWFGGRFFGVQAVRLVRGPRVALGHLGQT